MEKTIIILNGHSASKNTLVLVSFDKEYVHYKLIAPLSNALRCGVDAENSDKITWIDPSGGPMMSIGYKVNDLKLVEIYHSKKHNAFILKFERV
jgi:hypothetical protein